MVTVDAEAVARRLDNFVMGELKGLPRTRVYRLIRKGEVRVNKGRARPSYKLQLGDIVRLPPVSRDSTVPGAADPDRSRWILAHILYEDGGLLVLDKPSGLAVHGGSGISLGAIELLRAARPAERYLELVHRLDRDTSGCLLIAKKRSVLRALHEQLREGEMDKRYMALLLGAWSGGPKHVNLALEVEHRQNGERHVRVDPAGKPARTLFTPVEQFAAATLVTAELYTGRTHQIRVHAAAIGHPVAGDARYAVDQGDVVGLQRLFLHAAELGFVHPQTAEPVQFTAPLPEPLLGVIRGLRAA